MNKILRIKIPFLEMKTLTFCIGIALTCLATSMSAPLENIPVRREKTPNLMEIIDVILNDPEFLSLRTEQQLRVLLIIYDTLEKHLNAAINKD